MSFWAVGATVASTAIGVYSSERQRKDAKRASKEVSKITDSELAFQQQRYDRWKSIYGDLQEDIGEYYKNLKGSDFLPEQLNQVQEHYQLAQRNTDASLAQRGLDISGITAQTVMANNFNSAKDKAHLVNTADDKIRQAQQGFLNAGLNQGNTIVNGISNVKNRQSNTILQGTAEANRHRQATTNTIGGAIGYGSTLLAGSNRKPSNQGYINAESNGAF